MAITYNKDKRSGLTYAYETTYVWDKEKKQPRSKRKYLGRVDPETKEIIRKNDKKNSAEMVVGSVDLQALRKEIEKKDKIISDLQKSLEEANERYGSLAEKVRAVRLVISQELSDV